MRRRASEGRSLRLDRADYRPFRDGAIVFLSALLTFLVMLLWHRLLRMSRDTGACRNTNWLRSQPKKKKSMQKKPTWRGTDFRRSRNAYMLCASEFFMA